MPTDAALIADLERHIRTMRAEADALEGMTSTAAPEISALRRHVAEVEALFGLLRAALPDQPEGHPARSGC